MPLSADLVVHSPETATEQVGEMEEARLAGTTAPHPGPYRTKHGGARGQRVSI